jgi:demethylmenaquinone methyltransferase/2-methoxy-6-polyprenyl-1,4-benzoquinol methylase
VVYNAFPHFPDPERLIRTLSGLLKPDGTLTVAHGMSREKIDAHHHGTASHVSNGLISAADLAAIFGKHLTVTTVISDERMYQVVGIKR